MFLFFPYLIGNFLGYDYNGTGLFESINVSVLILSLLIQNIILFGLIGYCIDYRKNKLPINQQDNNSMRLGRFDISCSNNIIKQCELFRSDILLYAWVWYLLSKNKQKRSIAFRFLQI